MLKKVQIGSETIPYTSLESRAIPAMPVNGESLELSSNITSELTENDWERDCSNTVFWQAEN